MDLAINDSQRLICHKTQTNKQKVTTTNIYTTVQKISQENFKFLTEINTLKEKSLRPPICPPLPEINPDLNTKAKHSNYPNQTRNFP